MSMVALGGVIWFVSHNKHSFVSHFQYNSNVSMQVPGLSFTLAISELGTKNLVAGTSRLMSSFSCILQLSFGIEAGVKV